MNHTLLLAVLIALPLRASTISLSCTTEVITQSGTQSQQSTTTPCSTFVQEQSTIISAYARIHNEGISVSVQGSQLGPGTSARAFATRSEEAQFEQLVPGVGTGYMEVNWYWKKMTAIGSSAYSGPEYATVSDPLPTLLFNGQDVLQWSEFAGGWANISDSAFMWTGCGPRCELFYARLMIPIVFGAAFTYGAQHAMSIEQQITGGENYSGYMREYNAYFRQISMTNTLGRPPGTRNGVTIYNSDFTPWVEAESEASPHPEPSFALVLALVLILLALIHKKGDQDKA